MLIHYVFDLLALLSGLLVSTWFRRKYALSKPTGITQESQHHYYLLVLLFGLIAGSMLFGTLNLHLSGQTGVAKSMLGGVFGAIVAAELFKYFADIRQSTGLYFVPGLIMLIAVGRIGCFLAGLPDFTYGTPTNLPWGVDFGDGIKRHPVQLYETFAMLAFLAVLLMSYPKHSAFWQTQGFYVFVLFYAGQRFIWEFLKPYSAVFYPFNLFQLLCLLMLGYAVLMLVKTRKNHG
ncbi:MAG TPA: prolipoprotein diacylglyceryl transferase [Thiolinea sp.]|nr:prolipoprotein diacylglyceryl transferase [Thiolinea sp.]